MQVCAIFWVENTVVVKGKRSMLDSHLIFYLVSGVLASKVLSRFSAILYGKNAKDWSNSSGVTAAAALGWLKQLWGVNAAVAITLPPLKQVPRGALCPEIWWQAAWQLCGLDLAQRPCLTPLVKGKQLQDIACTICKGPVSDESRENGKFDYQKSPRMHAEPISPVL